MTAHDGRHPAGLGRNRTAGALAFIACVAFGTPAGAVALNHESSSRSVASPGAPQRGVAEAAAPSDAGRGEALKGLSGGVGHGAEVAEPDDYRQTDYRTPVPKTLRGATVITTEEAEALHAAGDALFVDVYPRAPKPPNLPVGTLWRDPPHSTIKGGVWLPNVGYGTLPPEDVGYFKSQLERITAGDKARPIVFYCLRDCWMSWNAGKRALEYGYENVIWFPEGTDGWQEAGNDMESVQPQK